MTLQRRISRAERAAQGRGLAERQINWGRPTAETSEAVWDLVSPFLGVRISDLASDETTATQALVVTLAVHRGCSALLPTHRRHFQRLLDKVDPDVLPQQALSGCFTGRADGLLGT